MWAAALPHLRKSWVWRWWAIIVPMQIKRSALNSAWVIRWKNASCGLLRAIETIINPSCLRVE